MIHVYIIEFAILLYVIDGFSSVIRRTIRVSILWIKSKYVMLGWSRDIDDFHVYIVACCLFMITRQ